MVDIKKIADLWAVCTYDDCQMAGQCLRHRVCRELPERWMQWASVMPSARGADGSCRYFQKDEKVVMARGLKSLYNNVHDRHACHELRTALLQFFGSNGSYYRYYNGERWMNPELQEQVQKILRSYGVEDERPFDEYVEDYDYTVFPMGT